MSSANSLRCALIAFFLLLTVSPLDAQFSKKAAAPAPVPPQIVAAQKIFISNGGGGSRILEGEIVGQTVFNGGPDRPYDEFYAAMQSSGHYQLVSSPADADLVFEISWDISDTGFRLPILGQLRLVVIDPRTHITLWTISEYVRGAMLLGNRDKNFDQSMQMVTTRLRALSLPVATAPAASQN